MEPDCPILQNGIKVSACGCHDALHELAYRLKRAEAEASAARGWLKMYVRDSAAAERRGMERAARLLCVHCANGEPLEPASPGVETLYQHPCDAKDCDLGGGPHPCDADLILDALAAEEDDA